MSAASAVSELTRSAQARWARTRSVGRTAFVWRYGVAGWGVPAGTVTSCYHVIHEHTPGAAWSIAGLRPLWQSIVGLMIACGIVGYLFGAWLWDSCEARFAPHPGASDPGASDPGEPDLGTRDAGTSDPDAT